MPRSLVVKVTCGAEEPERLNQGFTVAAAAAASGAEVSQWLTGDAASGTITVCSQCAARRGIVAGDLREGVTIAGAAVFAEQVLGEGVQALVY